MKFQAAHRDESYKNFFLTVDEENGRVTVKVWKSTPFEQPPLAGEISGQTVQRALADARKYIDSGAADESLSCPF